MAGSNPFPFIQLATALLGAAVPGSAPLLGAVGGLVQQAQQPPMAHPDVEVQGAVTQLNLSDARIAALEKRVATLEHALQLSLTAHAIQWGVAPPEGD